MKASAQFEAYGRSARSRGMPFVWVKRHYRLNDIEPWAKAALARGYMLQAKQGGKHDRPSPLTN